ncbi:MULTISPECIES: hypothetical protein [Clostridia]|uniref:hypothetical protein n=1 Tax=Clostridia TaxID=186801 RepID=UPI000EA2D984|nr:MULTISPECIES: hypothetical protein [Clostridia]NBJ68275.1 hypothetical protein [Roseburia sp. 1XD42-34]RKI82037.1 hypothetical protein D7V87_02125 [Clostridium sp. 1xD42-85]
MKKKWIYWISIFGFLLTAWGFIPLYSFASQVAYMIKNDGTQASVNITPTIIFLFISTGFGLLLYRHNSKKHKNISLKLLMPVEFSEQDEREKIITANACRKVYLFMPFVFGFTLFLMLLYPFIDDVIPFYPMLLLFVYPIAQITIYYLSIRKQL